MPTPHIAAADHDFAKVVLMPGDPKRAQWIADTFLHDVKLVNDVRGILGFTGLTKNEKRVSVMASGMGMPSIGIYSHELFTKYGVEAIIRIGTCGSYQREIGLNEIVFAMGSCTDSNWMSQYHLQGCTYSAICDYELLESGVAAAKKAGYVYHVGNVLAADIFYDYDKEVWKKWAELGVLAVEMESYALYQTAALLHKRALTILTTSDSFILENKLTSEERHTGLGHMVEIALAAAEQYA
jgi:purine-nucleoside phosphorylase